MKDLPVLIAVDDDAEALRRIESALASRYGGDYAIQCFGSAVEALEAIRDLTTRGVELAVVLAAQKLPGMGGGTLLYEVGEVQPLAKRGLLIPWGGWGDRDTAAMIHDGMARDDFDYYVMKPTAEPDEQFHRTISEFLQEWSRAGALSPDTRSEGSSARAAVRRRETRTGHGPGSSPAGQGSGHLAAGPRRRRLR